MKTTRLIQNRNKTHRNIKRPPFECIALLLQGGGALGAYQAGVYEALSETDVLPDWVGGISIGSVNCAIIAGNPPQDRVKKLREFWELVSSGTLWDSFSEIERKVARGDLSHLLVNQMHAGYTLLNGIHSFFKPRFPGPWLSETGSAGAISYYDTSPLRQTLERLVDFDRLNSGEMCMSIGATNVKSGNFTYFDTRNDTITVDHVMASAALPPSFPYVEIDGEYYWDGGLVSNTPLEWVLDSRIRQDTLAFQVDLWSALGELPNNMSEVATRQKEILYSSRTRAATDKFKYRQEIRHALGKMLKKLPAGVRNDKDMKLLSSIADEKVYNIVHLIYRAQSYEGDSKDYEFSRLSMQAHWQAGYHATVRSLRHPEILQKPENDEGVMTFDIAHME